MEIQNSDELSNNRNKERKECSAINGFIQGGSREQIWQHSVSDFRLTSPPVARHLQRGPPLALAMVTICIGPVCVPLHLLLPFLVGLMHRRGWFRWFKQEWVTIKFWKSWWAGVPQPKAEASAIPDVKTADAKAHEMDAEQPKSGSNTTNSQARSQNEIAGFDQVPKSLHTTPGLQQRGIQQQQSHASR